MAVATAAELTTVQFNRTQYIRCNTLGHAWDDVDSDWKPEWGEPLTVRCERCGTERRDKLDRRTGALLPGGRRYIYPYGYKYGRGERPSRAEFRVQLLEQRIREARSARKKR